jgi:hypothetical protein
LLYSSFAAKYNLDAKKFLADQHRFGPHPYLGGFCTILFYYTLKLGPALDCSISGQLFSEIAEKVLTEVIHHFHSEEFIIILFIVFIFFIISYVDRFETAWLLVVPPCHEETINRTTRKFAGGFDLFEFKKKK